MSSICVIPARGGSKRIPRKNIRLFHKKPMIAWPIKAAIDSGCFDKVVVSTEDDEIKKIAIECGAEVPFRRPMNLADDYTATKPVINHAIRELTNQGIFCKYVCCLYPTAVFVSGKDIEKGYKKLVSLGKDFVFTATEYAVPIDWAFKEEQNGKLRRIFPEHALTRSQDLPRYFYDAGQFYWGKADSFLELKDTVQSDSEIIKLPQNKVRDIDTLEDWEYAESTFEIIMTNNA